MVDPRLLAAKAAAVVCDDQGREYLAVHPRYSSASITAYYCVLLCRVGLVLGSVAMLALSMLGQTLPYCSGMRNDRDAWAYRVSVWRTWIVTDNAVVLYSTARGSLPLIILSSMTSAISFLSMILTTLFASKWARYEGLRREAEATNLLMVAVYGRIAGDAQRVSFDTMGYSNQRVENRALVGQVPLEEMEKQRRLRDSIAGAAVFGVLLSNTTIATLVMVLMVRDFRTYASWPAPGHLSESFVLFTVMMVLGLASLILLSVPSIMKMYLFCAPPLLRCPLMVIQAEDEKEEGDDVVPASAGRPTLAGMPTEPRQSPVRHPLGSGVAPCAPTEALPWCSTYQGEVAGSLVAPRNRP